MAADTYNKAYKFGIYPNEVQKILFAKTFGCVRFVYNHYLYIRKMGYPKFKSKKNHHNSYTACVTNGNVRLENGVLKLPKAKLVKVKQHRNIPSGYTLKSATISQTPTGKYFVSSERDIAVDADARLPHCQKQSRRYKKQKYKVAKMNEKYLLNT